jgi:hypothetical protein
VDALRVYTITKKSSLQGASIKGWALQRPPHFEEVTIMPEEVNQELKTDFEKAKAEVAANYNVVRDEGWLKKVISYVEHLEELIGLREPAPETTDPVPEATDAKPKKK